MKKITLIIFTILTAVIWCSCTESESADISNVKIDYGVSEVYSKADIESAAMVVENKFKTFEGCNLYLLKYEGDDYCKDNLSYCKELDSSKEFIDCMVFKSKFRSPKNGGGNWEADTVYDDWEWFLAREKDGSWKLLTWGVG